ncbi:MAG: hypothetical protein UT24_C0025G0008 [Candidatus Woesebacteria bacterium GW2011_GWB1_39_12]|uniref:TrpR like protein, YerC/YecD n=2 Tax=Candidatus Woeseibacteriota TaxID=1752722 RepID=A0A0G0MBX9_9BACT|nr:MAG: hypothetical protein UT23_C0007G0008 [Candidatus Woesebacteria bacterium GW2011_GWA1_39_12]KKQ99291.1 MAG: hypothetical protein UT24_C0025G0008 [Candidatus Woesebacteria bacterium GW2011_GWB1_39_12]
MRRYKFLDKEFVYSALNRLRASFLAAKDGNDVEEIIKAILTYDERMKIGRRIQIAEMIKEGMQYRQIAKELKVGLTTVMLVARKLDENPFGYELITDREKKVEKEYNYRAYQKIGGSKMIFKKKEYTGFTRKDVKR